MHNKTKIFIEKSISIHGNIYDYSKSNYINSRTKIVIECKSHGEFSILPHNHLIQKSGCPKCSTEKHKLTKISEKRLNKIKSVHKNKYSYENLEIKDGFISIICPVHGEFAQRIYAHEKGHGCKNCNIDSKKSQKKELKRKCVSCKKDKELINFNKKFKICKSCQISPIIPDTKTCIHCKMYKNLSEFQPRKSQWDGYRNSCMECHKKTEKHRKKIWRRKNKNSIREKCRIYHKNRMETDITYRVKIISRNVIRKALYKVGYTKKSRTYQILGCSYEEFRYHLENQFLEGMNWENRNLWEIDHIVPISIAKSEEEILILNHYQNLRPLWKGENQKKSNEITDEVLQSSIYREILDNRNLSFGVNLEEFIK